MRLPIRMRRREREEILRLQLLADSRNRVGGFRRELQRLDISAGVFRQALEVGHVHGCPAARANPDGVQRRARPADRLSCRLNRGGALSLDFLMKAGLNLVLPLLGLLSLCVG